MTNERRRTTTQREHRRLTRFETINVGQEFYHGATLYVKKSLSSATTAVTGRLQRFTPSTRVLPKAAPRRAELSARQLAADAYHRFVEACDSLRV